MFDLRMNGAGERGEGGEGGGRGGQEESAATSALHPILLFSLSPHNLPPLPPTNLTKEVEAPY